MLIHLYSVSLPFTVSPTQSGLLSQLYRGEIDIIEILQGKSLPDTLERIKVEAMAKAV